MITLTKIKARIEKKNPKFTKILIPFLEIPEDVKIIIKYPKVSTKDNIIPFIKKFLPPNESLIKRKIP